jgi:hypothetical protein
MSPVRWIAPMFMPSSRARLPPAWRSRDSFSLMVDRGGLALHPNGGREILFRGTRMHVKVGHVQHSWDVRSHRVTRTASEVLVHREGLCHAKSHLLATLLRHLGVPSGLAYQRLTSGDTQEREYITHGLNTVLL